MTPFFSSWALWQKMTFILACALTATVGVGLIKRYIAARTLRRYAALATNELPMPLQTPSSVPLTSDADVEAQAPSSLFGIRAVESGIEIDGVWISPTISPVSSRDSSPRSSGRISRNDSRISLSRNSSPDRLSRISKQRISSSFVASPSQSLSGERRSSRPPSFAPKVRFADDIQNGYAQATIRQPSLPRDYAVAELSKYGHESSVGPHHDIGENALGSSKTASVSSLCGSQTSSIASAQRQTPSNTTESLALSLDAGDMDRIDRPRLSQAASMGQLARRARSRAADSRETEESISLTEQADIANKSLPPRPCTPLRTPAVIISPASPSVSTTSLVSSQKSSRDSMSSQTPASIESWHTSPASTISLAPDSPSAIMKSQSNTHGKPDISVPSLVPDRSDQVTATAAKELHVLQDEPEVARGRPRRRLQKKRKSESLRMSAQGQASQ